MPPSPGQPVETARNLRPVVERVKQFETLLAFGVSEVPHHPQTSLVGLQKWRELAFVLY